MTFRERLDQEFAARRQLNNRYSLRAFAAFLRVDHATLSQILRGKRGVPSHRELLQLSRQPEFLGDCRWVAGRLGVSVDAVNVALSRLLRLGLLEMTAKGIWREKTGLSEITTQQFSTFVAERMPSPLEA